MRSKRSQGFEYSERGIYDAGGKSGTNWSKNTSNVFPSKCLGITRMDFGYPATVIYFFKK